MINAKERARVAEVHREVAGRMSEQAPRAVLKGADTPTRTQWSRPLARPVFEELWRHKPRHKPRHSDQLGPTNKKALFENRAF